MQHLDWNQLKTGIGFEDLTPWRCTFMNRYL